MTTREQIVNAVSQSLMEFGYADATPPLIEEIYDAYKVGKRYPDLPHGVLGAFAERQLHDFEERGGELP